MGITAQERRELEQMRDAIAKRYDELDDQCRYGTMNDEERHHILTQEFGPDWLATLRDLNQLIHHKQRTPRQEAIGILTLAAVGLILGFLALSPTINGMAAAQTHTVESGLVLLDGDTARIETAGTIAMVDVSYHGPGTYTLYLEDANARHTLVTGDADTNTCTGCGPHYSEPLMLSAQTDGGSITINSITYEAQP